MLEIILEAREVTKSFGRGPDAVCALDRLSLTVCRGEVLVLVGASGCGKSTLLNLMAGFEKPTEGEVLLDAEPVVRVEPRCGMVFQRYALFPWKTVRGNIEFGPAMNGVAKRKRREKADQLIESVGLQGFESAYPNQLSGGLRQRVALARVLANEPEVMLCDEPFAALDAMTRQILQDELLRIVQQTGQTVVFVTHSIDEVLILSDTIVVMSSRPGRIKTMIQNDLPRPRRVDVQLSTDYIDMKKTIWNAVEEEVLASSGRTKHP